MMHPPCHVVGGGVGGNKRWNKRPNIPPAAAALAALPPPASAAPMATRSSKMSHQKKKFLFGGNIRDPLNLNSLTSEEKEEQRSRNFPDKRALRSLAAQALVRMRHLRNEPGIISLYFKTFQQTEGGGASQSFK